MQTSTPPSSPQADGGTLLQPFGPIVDRGSSITGLLWAEAAIACIVIGLRFWSRNLGKLVGLHDWTMVVATISMVVCSSITTWMAHLGGFRHIWQIPPPNIPNVILASYIFQTFIIIGVFTSKFSVGYLLLRIFPQYSKRSRAFVWFVIVFTVLHNLLALILNWYDAAPRDMDSSEAKLGWIYMGLTLNIFADFILAVLPAPIVYNLKVSLAKRVRVYMLLSLSLLATVCAILKFIYMKTLLHTEDFGWATWELTIWSQSEVFVIILCGSVAPMKQLAEHLFGKPSLGSTGYRSFGYSRSGFKSSGTKAGTRSGEDIELNN
ncbi:hypothetical protein BCR34DRAFT_605588 [Clohesyomyces aquaticus]|uniref:Rhodopsin domain-containing protein n=1 Tax=Clohesyomyces aquaticus TaxID=1231657 RepID=A0A1Y1YXR4_9PLEO|nr:hypothetical protein BCR34DRAFT_605588 [Clohesyomyces aquaticus]